MEYYCNTENNYCKKLTSIALNRMRRNIYILIRAVHVDNQKEKWIMKQLLFQCSGIMGEYLNFIECPFNK